MSVDALFLKFSTDKLLQFMERIEICVDRLSEEQIWARGGENENAVGNLLIHLEGNVRQWIITTLGDDPAPRDRDAEFNARGGHIAAELKARLRRTVERATEVIGAMDEEQLTRMYDVQIYKVSGLDAVYHVVEHFAEHTGQIIYITKMLTHGDLGFYRHLRASAPSEEMP